MHEVFRDFIYRVTPTQAEMKRVNDRIARVTDALFERMWIIDNPGTESQSIREPIRDTVKLRWIDHSAPWPYPAAYIGKAVMGSVKRKTVLSPVEDVDMLVLLQCLNGVTLNSWTPDGLLACMRETLSGIAPKIDIWQGECITLRFADPPAVDVFPAFNMFNQVTYMYPKRGNTWYRSNPTALDQLFLRRDQELEGNLSAVCVLLKCWNRRQEVKLQSSHLDLMATRYTKMDNFYPRWLHSFFLHAKHYGVSYLEMPTPDGAYADAAHYLSTAQKAIVIEQMIKAEKLCRKAIEALRVDDDKTAITLYGKLFGKKFIPSGQR